MGLRPFDVNRLKMPPLLVGAGRMYLLLPRYSDIPAFSGGLAWAQNVFANPRVRFTLRCPCRVLEVVGAAGSRNWAWKFSRGHTYRKQARRDELLGGSRYQDQDLTCHYEFQISIASPIRYDEPRPRYQTRVVITTCAPVSGVVPLLWISQELGFFRAPPDKRRKKIKEGKRSRKGKEEEKQRKKKKKKREGTILIEAEFSECWKEGAVAPGSMLRTTETGGIWDHGDMP